MSRRKPSVPRSGYKLAATGRPGGPVSLEWQHVAVEAWCGTGEDEPGHLAARAGRDTYPGADPQIWCEGHDRGVRGPDGSLKIRVRCDTCGPRGPDWQRSAAWLDQVLGAMAAQAGPGGHLVRRLYLRGGSTLI